MCHGAHAQVSRQCAGSRWTECVEGVTTRAKTWSDYDGCSARKSKIVACDLRREVDNSELSNCQPQYSLAGSKRVTPRPRARQEDVDGPIKTDVDPSLLQGIASQLHPPSCAADVVALHRLFSKLLGNPATCFQRDRMIEIQAIEACCQYEVLGVITRIILKGKLEVLLMIAATPLPIMSKDPKIRLIGAAHAHICCLSRVRQSCRRSRHARSMPAARTRSVCSWNLANQRRLEDSHHPAQEQFL